jgi:hypothetical protein
MRPKEAGLNLKQWLYWTTLSQPSLMVKLAPMFLEQ